MGKGDIGVWDGFRTLKETLPLGDGEGVLAASPYRP
jgi:hypothetical protein